MWEASVFINDDKFLLDICTYNIVDAAFVFMLS